MRLEKDFFMKRADIVARELLGKVLVRKLKNKEIKARIVETEAYFDEKDPASRACKNGDLRETMRCEGGTILVYGVHNCWLINFVTGKSEDAQAVLLRAVEPLNFSAKTSGPGLLTKAMKIDKKLHRNDICSCEEIFVEDADRDYFDSGSLRIVDAFRIGVKKDLPEKMRFYIDGNEWVSRK